MKRRAFIASLTASVGLLVSAFGSPLSKVKALVERPPIRERILVFGTSWDVDPWFEHEFWGETKYHNKDVQAQVGGAKSQLDLGCPWVKRWNVQFGVPRVEAISSEYKKEFTGGLLRARLQDLAASKVGKPKVIPLP